MRTLEETIAVSFSRLSADAALKMPQSALAGGWEPGALGPTIQDRLGGVQASRNSCLVTGDSVAVIAPTLR